MKSDPGLSVVIPAYNEQESVQPVISEISSVLKSLKKPYEIVIVDDGSTDQTSTRIPQAANIKVVRHADRKGYGRSLADGIAAAEYDTIAIMDADGTYPAEALPQMLKVQDSADMVVGHRKKIKMPNAALPKSFFRKMIHLWAWALTGRRIPDMNSGFRIFKKDMWSRHKRDYPEGFSFTTTLTMLCLFERKVVRFIPIEYRARTGKSKVHYIADGLQLAWRMVKLTIRHKPSRFLLPLFLLTALVVRLIGIGYGLPGTYFADEPHHINVALNFFNGDLNPHVFKYPTLWMYMLAALFGSVFSVCSLLGGGSTPTEFAHLFVWNPTLIYLSARIFTVVCGVVAIYAAYRASHKSGKEDAAKVTLLSLVFSGPLIIFSHQAKADMLLLCFCGWTWYFGIKYVLYGRPRDLLWAGAFLGWAGSTQYTAALLIPILFWAVLFCTQRTPRHFLYLLGAYALCGAAFVSGTPFSILDFGVFSSYVRDLLNYGAGDFTANPERVGVRAIGYLLSFPGYWLTGAVILAAGAWGYLKEQKKVFLFIMATVAGGGLFFSSQSRQAGVINYAFPLYPGLAVLAGGSAFLFRSKKAKRWGGLAAAVLFVPAAIAAARLASTYHEIDPRTEAKTWIEKNIPEGAKILMEEPHVSPPIVMQRDQLQRLAEATAKAGHPRSRYYEALVDSHPGGGYEVIRRFRNPSETVSGKMITEWSQEGYELLDVEPGLSALRQHGIQYAVISSWSPPPRLKTFFDELKTQNLLAQFPTRNDELAPSISIYRLNE